ncbi:MAG: HAD family hydrolase [Firmicutes bacterium]|nr:HAD family hydrolase [Bacillota bacterium]
MGVETRWVTFDLDGTLADSPFARVVMPWLHDCLLQRGVASPRDALRQEHTRRLEAGDDVAAYHWDDIASAVLGAQGEFAPPAPPALPVPPTLPMPIVEAMRGELKSDIAAFPLYADVAPVLADLRERGFSLAVLSNGHVGYQRTLLELMGVIGSFDLILGPDNAGSAKPDVGMFAHGLLAGRIALHVGDLLTQDVQAARLAGIQAAWVARQLAPAAGQQDGNDVRDAGGTGGTGENTDSDWLHLAPCERPRMALASGWLDAQVTRELAALGRARTIGPLDEAADQVPDAIILQMDEILSLLP